MLLIACLLMGGGFAEVCDFIGDDIGTLTASAAAVVVIESGECGDNVTYTLDSKGTLTISGSGNMEEYDWSSSPFYENRNIKKVIIENGVTYIGGLSFRGCSSLTSIEIPNSVILICDGAFNGCSSLTNIIIPNSVTSIGESA